MAATSHNIRAPPSFVKFENHKSDLTEETKMESDFRKTDYAINKHRKGIAYRNADGSVLEVTFEKIAKDNPNFTMEDFEKLKQLSDELYHEEAKSDWNYHYHIAGNLDEDFINKWISSSNLENDIMARYDEVAFNEQLGEAVNTALTSVQRRRFIHTILTARQQEK